MNFFGIISLVIALAIGVWWIGQGVDSTINDSSNNSEGGYKNAIDSAKDAAGKLGTSSAVPTTETDQPKTTDPGTGKSITVYDGIAVSEGVTVLNLSGKGLSGSLKGEVHFLSNLKELNISDNNFTGLPAEVGQLSKLEVLNLSNNPLTGLPHELANLKNLKVLDLRGTNYANADLEVIKKGLPMSVQVLVD